MYQKKFWVVFWLFVVAIVFFDIWDVYVSHESRVELVGEQTSKFLSFLYPICWVALFVWMLWGSQKCYISPWQTKPPLQPPAEITEPDSDDS